MRALPGVLNNAPTPSGIHDLAGRKGTGYAVLRQRLEAESFNRDAVEWAIHRHVEAGRLEALPGFTSTPGVYRDGGWAMNPVTNPTYDRERCALWAQPALWAWWNAIEIPTESSQPNPVVTAMSTDLPSPFTVPEPNWTLGEANVPQLENLPEVWTLGALLQQLRTFAGRYIDPHESVVPPCGGVVCVGSLAHAAIVLAYRRALNSVPGFDEFQTEILLRYEAAITVSSVHRLIRDVIRASGGSMTLSQAEQLEIVEALRRLKPPKEQAPENTPPGQTAPAEKQDRNETQEPAAIQQERKLSDRQKLILTEMLAMGAVGSTKKTTRNEVVQRIDKKKTGADFARDFGALKEGRYTDSDAGPDGGVWLTGKGKTKAEEVKRENGQ